jgi:hypothetical protein
MFNRHIQIAEIAEIVSLPDHPRWRGGSYPAGMASLEFDHVGVVMHDLESTARLFVGLGFIREGPIVVSGSWMDRIIGLEGARAELTTVRASDGHEHLELTTFHELSRAEAPPPTLLARLMFTATSRIGSPISKQPFRKPERPAMNRRRGCELPGHLAAHLYSRA